MPKSPTDDDPAALSRALHASERRQAAMLDASLDAVLGMDGAGRITGFNPAAERMFGRHAEDVVGVEMARAIVPAHLRDAHRRGLRRHLEGGPPSVLDRRVEVTALHADGREFP